RQPRAEWMIGGLEADQEHALAIEPNAVQAGLVAVEQPCVARPEARLDERTGRGDPSSEVGERDAGAPPAARPGYDAHPRLRDDAERTLGADHEARRFGAGPRARVAVGRERTARRDHRDRVREIVDPRRTGRIMAACAGREPAPQRRELERLWEVTER